MNPTEPTETVVENPADPATIQQTVVSSPTPPEPPKSHKKLIILIVLGVLIFLSALGVASWFFVANILSGDKSQDTTGTTSEGTISIGETPEEVYYNNVAFFNWYKQSYDEIVESGGNIQATIDLVVPGGRQMCTKLEKSTFTRQDVDKSLMTVLFATANDSLCPEYRKDLDGFIASLHDDAVTKDYERSENLVLDGTVDVEGMMYANTFCYASAVFYFGETETVSRDEAFQQAENTCMVLVSEFETNIAYYEWSAQNADERERVLKEAAQHAGLCTTTVCTQ
jgi:hypothetical protein